MLSEELLRCRVCGLRLGEAPWGENGRSPTFEYCPCCGVEFGYGDATPAAAQRWREKWLSGGAGWQDPIRQPDNWSCREQLSFVPLAFR